MLRHKVSVKPDFEALKSFQGSKSHLRIRTGKQDKLGTTSSFIFQHPDDQVYPGDFCDRKEHEECEDQKRTRLTEASHASSNTSQETQSAFARPDPGDRWLEISKDPPMPQDPKQQELWRRWRVQQDRKRALKEQAKENFGRSFTAGAGRNSRKMFTSRAVRAAGGDVSELAGELSCIEAGHRVHSQGGIVQRSPRAVISTSVGNARQWQARPNEGASHGSKVEAGHPFLSTRHTLSSNGTSSQGPNSRTAAFLQDERATASTTTRDGTTGLIAVSTQKKHVNRETPRKSVATLQEQDPEQSLALEELMRRLRHVSVNSEVTQEDKKLMEWSSLKKDGAASSPVDEAANPFGSAWSAPQGGLLSFGFLQPLKLSEGPGGRWSSGKQFQLHGIGRRNDSSVADTAGPGTTKKVPDEATGLARCSVCLELLKAGELRAPSLPVAGIFQRKTKVWPGSGEVCLSCQQGHAGDLRTGLPIAKRRKVEIVTEVKPGDSLWAISRRFTGSGAHWKELTKANPQYFRGGLPSSPSIEDCQVLIKPGWVLKVPIVDQPQNSLECHSDAQP